jgi:hypothetical protein
MYIFLGEADNVQHEIQQIILFSHKRKVAILWHRGVAPEYICEFVKTGFLLRCMAFLFRGPALCGAAMR